MHDPIPVQVVFIKIAQRDIQHNQIVEELGSVDHILALQKYGMGSYFLKVTKNYMKSQNIQVYAVIFN